jgi:hypothetical protein
MTLSGGENMAGSRSGWLLGVSLALGLSLPLTARDDQEEAEVPADKPVGVEAGLFHPPVRFTAADGVIDTGPVWGHSSPWVADVDGDGVNDLVVGDFSGLFRFYRNEGTKQKPRYAKPVNLQAGGVDAKVPIY